MNTVKPNLKIIASMAYLIAVIICISQAFDFRGAINFNWLLALIALTLPWSMVSVFFVWALIHGAGLDFFTLMYLSFAVLNLFIVRFLIKLFHTDETV